MEKDLRTRPPSESSLGSRRSLSRFWRRILVVAGVLVLVLAAATARLLVWPAQGMPAHVDAIVMLAGPGDRLPAALAIAREQRAPMLVVSRGHDGYSGPCPAPVPGVRLICFDPVPWNTRGEVEFAGRLAEKYHWRSVVLVTTAEQDTRARMMMKRCFGGSVYVMTAGQPLSSIPGQVAYGWGALLKALVVVRACLAGWPGFPSPRLPTTQLRNLNSKYPEN